jgi:hypothetical protein
MIRKLTVVISIDPQGTPRYNDQQGSAPGIADPGMWKVDFYFLPYTSIGNIKASWVEFDMKLDMITSYYAGIVLVANTGMHVQDGTDGMKREADWLLPILNDIANGRPALRNVSRLPGLFDGGWNKKNLVMWRESSTQHFPTPTGYYPLGLRMHQWLCRKLVGVSEVAISDPRDYRNTIFNDAIRNNRYNITIIPYWRYTAPMWDFHLGIDLVEPRYGGQQDCLHLGFTILLMQTILRVVADTVLSGVRS